jgi:hypothetical protein
LGDVHAWIRNDEPGRGGRGGEAKQHAFGGDAVWLDRKTSLKFDAVFIEQQRVFERAAGEEAFGESRQEDHIEAKPARLFDGADENTAVTALGRLSAQKTEAFGKDIRDFVERSGSNLAHGLEFAQNA